MIRDDYFGALFWDEPHLSAMTSYSCLPLKIIGKKWIWPSAFVWFSCMEKVQAQPVSCSNRIRSEHLSHSGGYFWYQKSTGETSNQPRSEEGARSGQTYLEIDQHWKAWPPVLQMQLLEDFKIGMWHPLWNARSDNTQCCNNNDSIH